MKTRLGKIIFAILFLLPVCANAIITKDFYYDGQIVDGDYFNKVNVWNTATVNMTGGSVPDNVIVHNSATFNFSGGNPGWISALDNSTANITGGFSAVSVGDNATGNISGNANVADASTGGSGTLNIYGGTIDVQLYSWQELIGDSHPFFLTSH